MNHSIVMTDLEIIIKGEIHTSTGDLEEEREILMGGVDHLILEGPEQEAEYRLFEQWYAWIMLIFRYIFARHFYVDKSILEDLADVQGATMEFTRESDLDILHNSHALVQIAALILFVLLLIISLWRGLTGYVFQGAGWLFISALGPLLVLRVHESGRGQAGRDKQIAQQIVDAAEDNGRIVTVVGHEHAKQIPKYLPDRLPEPDVRPPVYSRFSIKTAKELIYPSFVFFSVLYVGYSLLLAYARLFI